MSKATLHIASALDLLERLHEVRAQNLANVNTTGYRRRIASADAFARALRKAGGLPLAGLRVDVDFTPGRLEETGRPTDLALEGEGFFAVETERGVRYTRDGSFVLDREGRLVASDGAPVLGASGPIETDPSLGPIEISGDGSVLQRGTVVGRLRIVRFEDTSALVPEQGGRFRADGTEPLEATETRVVAGFLERSNVEPIDELVQMIAGFRAFEAAQKALVSIDRVRGEALDPRN